MRSGSRFEGPVNSISELFTPRRRLQYAILGEPREPLFEWKDYNPLLEMFKGKTVSSRSSSFIRSTIWELLKVYIRDTLPGSSLLPRMILYILLTVGGQTFIVYPLKWFVNAISFRNEELFYRYLMLYIGVAMLLIPLEGLFGWQRGRIMVHMQMWLSRHMVELFLEKRAYLTLQQDSRYCELDNPEQRIVDDSADFAWTVTLFSVAFIDQTLNCISFSIVLLTINPFLVPISLLVSVFTTAIALWIFGERLSSLFRASSQVTFNLRFQIIRVREYAESLAFYKAENAETSVSLQRLKACQDVSLDTIWWESMLWCYQSFLANIVYVVPYIILGPRIFQNPMGITYGELLQASSVFMSLFYSSMIFLTKMRDWSKMKAACHRIVRAIEVFTDIHHEFDGDCEERIWSQTGSVQSELGVEKPSRKIIKLCLSDQHSEPDHGHATAEVSTPLVRVKQLSIIYPSSVIAQVNDDKYEGISFDLNRGDSLLITGPSGVGKSSVLRAISGIWRLGRGEIVRPEDAVFLPQTVYMATPPATLKTQLLFPHLDQPVTSAELVAILHAVHLGYLLETVSSTGDTKGLDVSKNWALHLSMGEQQRIAIARLLLRKPTLVFLDEVTSALDPVLESEMYLLIKQTVETVVSVGHHTALRKYHTHQLKLFTGNTFEYEKISGNAKTD